MLNFCKSILLLCALAGSVSLLAQAAHAQVCPFDNGGSTLQNDGLVLTRYALGLRGASMVANTSFAAGDAATIESNIACPACGLRVTDDRDGLNNPIFTATDATIISRKLAGFEGASLTNGLALGSGTRNTPAAVQSFLLAGCGATGGTVTSVATGAGLTGGPITSAGSIGLAATQLLPTTACSMGQIAKWAGNAWSCSADNMGGSGTVLSVAGGAGIVATGPNVVNGVLTTSGLIELANGYILPQGCAAGEVPKSGGAGTWVCAADNAGTTVTNAFTQGGNAFGAPAVLGTTDGQPLTVGIGGGRGLRILPAAVATDPPNVLNGDATNTIGNSGGQQRGVTVAGGKNNRGGTPNGGYGWYSTISGGENNKTGKDDNSGGGDYTTIAGGKENTASGSYSTVAGGNLNTASGVVSTVAGGAENTASGLVSAVVGGHSNTASGDFSFSAGYRAKNNYDGAFVWADSTELDFKVKSSELTGPGANGWLTGVNTFNARATGGVWFVTAVSANGRPTAGPYVNAGSGTWAASSDRHSKTAIRAINAQDILRKVVALPISSWQYLTETGVRHIGPMSQDFKRLFAVGKDDKSITTIDADGVALAAIQGLNQKFAEQIKQKDNEIAKLRAKADSVEREMLAIKRKLGM